MHKKFFIEAHPDCSNFAILVIKDNGGRRHGFLEYFSHRDGVGIVKVEEGGDLEHQGWRELADKLIKIAEKVCADNGATLWSC